MANLTPAEYVLNDLGKDAELIRAVRIDSPNSRWKDIVQPLIWIVRTGKKRGGIFVVYSYEYEADGTTYKKNGFGKYFEINYYISLEMSRKAMDEFVADSAKQTEFMWNAVSEKNGIIDGPWSITQDPWDPNVVLKPLKVKKPPEEKPAETKPSETTGNSADVKKDEVVAKPATKTISIDPADVVGTLTLTKVSGPGEIIGLTELEIGQFGFDYGSEFSGIQFSDPGDYIIGVSSTSPDVEGATFSITVLPEPEVIPQDKSRDQKTELGTHRPIIAQIDQPTLKLESIEMRLDINRESTEVSADSMGMMPLVSYSSNPIQDRDIVILKLYHAGMIPKCQLTFVDSQNLIRNVGQPKDDTRVDVFIHARSNSLKSIHLSFVIEKFKQVSAGQYSIIGSLYIPGGQMLYQTQYGNFEGTSFEALREISKKMGLGFNSNIINTEDKMNWVYAGKKTWETMDEIIKNSYINDTSFMAGYIDFYYCMNYVDVQKESDRDISDDVGIETGVDKGTDLNKIVPQRFINEISMNKSAFYFAADPVTKQASTAKNLKKGYRTVLKYYDRKLKKFCVFKIESNTSDGKTSYILKAAPYDKKSFKKNETHIDLGEIDLDNVHKNYLYASELNRRNLDELSNLEMTLTLPNTNLNIYKYQKVHITLVNTAATVSDAEKIKWSHTGEWIIMDISYNFITEGSVKKFTQEVRVVKKEIGKSPEEIKKDGKQEPKKEETPKKQENPIPAAPNAGFNIGDVFRIKDKDGREWLMLVNLQNYDGTTILANIVSAEKTPVSKSELISENAQPIDEQTEKVATDQTKKSEEKTAEPKNTGDYNEGIIGILDPKSDNDKKVIGSVTFKKQGPRLAAIGKISGFPDGGTIEHEGEWASASDKEGLVREMIMVLTSKIESKYNVSVKLEIKEKKL